MVGSETLGKGINLFRERLREEIRGQFVEIESDVVACLGGGRDTFVGQQILERIFGLVHLPLFDYVLFY